MEPGNFDKAIRDALDRQILPPDQGAKERVWNRVEQQLHREPAHRKWKLAALILLLIMPSAALWMQNRKQASTILHLSSNLARLNSQVAMSPPAGEMISALPAPVVHDTVVRIAPAIVYTKIDTITQIHIVKDTVVVYRPVEMASLPMFNSGDPSQNEQTTTFRSETGQESQRAEFLLEPDHLSHRGRKKPERNFTFRFSLGATESGSESLAGIQTRL